MNYHIITKSVIVKPANEPIFSELCTEVMIDDEAAGPFIVIQQIARSDGKIYIDPAEWPMIKRAVEDMLVVIKVLAAD